MGRMIGDKVVLREFRSEDLSAMRAWITDGEATKYLSSTFIKPQTWEQSESFLRGILQGDVGGVNLVIAEKTSLKYLGQCNLMMIDHGARKAEMAIVMSPEHHGKGCAREAIALLLSFAFDQLNLNRVFLKVDEENTRAIRLYEYCGFRHEGRLRQEVYRDGGYHDLLVMGVLRGEQL